MLHNLIHTFIPALNLEIYMKVVYTRVRQYQISVCIMRARNYHNIIMVSTLTRTMQTPSELFMSVHAMLLTASTHVSAPLPYSAISLQLLI